MEFIVVFPWRCDDNDIHWLFDDYRQLHTRAVNGSDSPRLHQRQALSSEVLPCDGVNSDTGDHTAVAPPPSTASEPLIVHAGAVVSMLHLLPSIACQRQPQVINHRVILSFWSMRLSVVHILKHSVMYECNVLCCHNGITAYLLLDF